MELIKRKIVLDHYTSRKENNWGEMTATGFSFNIFITQDGDDMGVFTDYIKEDLVDSEPNYTTLITKLNSLGLTFPFMTGATFEVVSGNTYPYTRVPYVPLLDYSLDNHIVTGLTEDRLENVKTYNVLEKYRTDFITNRETYINYLGDTIQGIDKVVSNENDQNPLTYVEDVDINDPNLGEITQRTGLMFRTYNDEFVPSFAKFDEEIRKTEFYFRGQGFNQTNASLNPIIKEEYLFGITSTPEIQSDVFIDRGRHTILQQHLQLGEITNIGDLINYGNGFYNIVKQ